MSNVQYRKCLIYLIKVEQLILNFVDFGCVYIRKHYDVRYEIEFDIGDILRENYQLPLRFHLILLIRRLNPS